MISLLGLMLISIHLDKENMNKYFISFFFIFNLYFCALFLCNIIPLLKFNVLQIARAAVVFNVDEIIVFDEDGSTEKYA